MIDRHRNSLLQQHATQDIRLKGLFVQKPSSANQVRQAIAQAHPLTTRVGQVRLFASALNPYLNYINTVYQCLYLNTFVHIFSNYLAWTQENQAQVAIKSIATHDLAAMAALGMGQFAVLIALLNYGLQHLGAAQAALIFSLFPLLTLLLSAALGRERITPALLGGVVLSIAGVALSLAPKLGAQHAGHWWGELAVLASA